MSGQRECISRLLAVILCTAFLIWGIFPACSYAGENSSSETKIVVNIASHGMYLMERGTKTKLYPVACGKISSKTPIGYYKIQDMAARPAWKNTASAKKNTSTGNGTSSLFRWIGLGGKYGIGSTRIKSAIGQYTTNGSIYLLEKDAEDLYERVTIGTPVEIFYNRLVIEKIPDDTVVYYIYPDVYHCQPLTVAQVSKWLHGFGVDRLESDDAIAAKLKASDGKPTYIAKAYSLYVNGKEIKEWKCVEKEGIYYLPAFQMAQAAGVSMNYDKKTGLLSSKYGRVPGIEFKSMVYINSDDAEQLFNTVGGRWGNTLSYTFREY